MPSFRSYFLFYQNTFLSKSIPSVLTRITIIASLLERGFLIKPGPQEPLHSVLHFLLPSLLLISWLRWFHFLWLHTPDKVSQHQAVQGQLEKSWQPFSRACFPAPWCSFAHGSQSVLIYLFMRRGLGSKRFFFQHKSSKQTTESYFTDVSLTTTFGFLIYRLLKS